MKARSRSVAGFGCRLCLHVIGTNLLADIATKNMIAHQGSKMTRNPTLEFNGQVRNAAASVQDIRSYECSRGTGLETQITLSASIPNRAVISQRDTQKQFPKKKPRAFFRRNKMSVLPDPAYSRNSGIIPFQHGTRIDESFSFNSPVA